MRAKIADLEIEYDVSGAGPPLVLVHGGGLDLKTWEDMVPLLEPHFTVHRFDMRGFGKTTRLGETPLSMPVWADDLKSFIDHLQLDRPVMVGWSLGGAVIVQFAAAHPDGLRAAVLLGAPGQTAVGAVGASRAGFDTRQQLIREGFGPDEVIDRTFDFTRSAFSERSRQDNPRAVEAIRAGLKRNFSINYAEMVEALRLRTLTDEMLAAITAPTLVVVGDEDARTPPAMAEELHRGIAGSTLKVIAECGHYYGYEYPEVCSELVIEFASRL